MLLNLIPYLKLIRWNNLLMLLVSFVITRFLVIGLLFEEQPAGGSFFFYTTITLLIAAAGYALNDYFDVEIDRVNKPERMILGIEIPIGYGKSLAAGLYIVALIITCIYSYRIFSLIPLVIFIAAGLTTCLYAAKLKRSLFAGNIAVAFLSSGPVLIPWIFEIRISSSNASEPMGNIISLIFAALFAFAWVLHLMREIAKDAEDMQGDRAFGCNTIPIYLGIPKTRKIIFSITLVSSAMALAASWICFTSECYISAVLLSVLVFIPHFYLLLRIPSASESSHFAAISRFIKWLMAAGLLATCVVSLEIHSLLILS